jgi:stalled ribosome rescue protein Dom34
VEEDTLIQLEDGNTIPIKYLSKNEKILAYSFEKFTPVFTNSFEIFKRKSKKAHELIFEGWAKSLILTPEHRVFVLDKNKVSEKSVEEVKVGDKLLLLTNSKLEKKRDKKEGINLLDKIHNSGVIEIEVKEKKEIISDKEFYDLYVPGVNSFVANGIIVHNSQKRYDRLRDDALNEFLVKVGEEASNLLLKQENLKGVIIGGPGPVKETFYDKKYLHYQIQKKVLGVKDIGSTDEYGLEELVFKSQDLLKEAMISKERELMQKFFSELKNNGNVVYGFEETRKALEAGAVDVLLLSEEFNWLHVKFRCKCGFTTEKDLPKYLVEKQKCPNCGQKLIEEESRELVDELVEKASSLGTRVEYISTETSEGIQFREIGGIGGFLRYKLS